MPPINGPGAGGLASTPQTITTAIAVNAIQYWGATSRKRWRAPATTTLKATITDRPSGVNLSGVGAMWMLTRYQAMVAARKIRIVRNCIRGYPYWTSERARRGGPL